MGILDPNLVIKNIKPKEKPTNKGFRFQKDQPIGPYNFPLSRVTTWRAFGFMIGAGGIKRPRWIEKTIPTGKPFIPDLDEVISVYPVQHGGFVPPREEKNKDYSNED